MVRLQVLRIYLKIDGQLFKDENSDKTKVEKLQNSGILGSKVKLMSINEHDNILALTSHLPHAIAYNIGMTAISTIKRMIL